MANNDDVVELKGKRSNISNKELENLDIFDSVTIPFLKCLNCEEKRRLICRHCVNFGVKTPHYDESLSKKQQRYLNIQDDLKVFTQRCEHLIKEKCAVEDVLFENKRCREQDYELLQVLDKHRSYVQTLKNKHNELYKANSNNRKRLPNYAKKVKELKDYVLDRKEEIRKLREHYNSLEGKHKILSRSGISQLVEHIFPISEIVLKDERLPKKLKTTTSSTGDSETIAALAEAKNTYNVLRGKWILYGSGIIEVQYRIVGPSLPANGDYSAYLDWLKDKDDAPKTTTKAVFPSRVNGYRIMAALMYTTQLLQLICYYLNVRLPNKVLYGDFTKKLNEEQFLSKVFKLNSNIMYLAFTQNVNLSSLNEEHTLENIIKILDPEKFDLGRHSCRDVANDSLVKKEISVVTAIDTESELESEDWEELPELINTNLMPTATGPQQSTIAESIMTSATNRITSIFRWIK